MYKYLFPLFLLLSSCSPKIIGYLDDKSDFKNYKTYLILNFNKPQEKMSPEGMKIIDRIEKYIQEEMTTRGYERVGKNPDLLLRYDLIANTRVESSFDPYGITYYPMVTMRTIHESALLIELKKTSNRKLVWQASIDLGQHAKKTKRKDNLQDAIHDIYTSYQYRAQNSKPDPTLAE